MGKIKTVFKKFLGFEEDLEIDEQSINLDDELNKQRSYYSETPVEEPVQQEVARDESPRRPVFQEISRQEVIMYPKNYSEACDVVEQIELGAIVTVNMENLDLETCKRISDFVLGAVYVLQGDVEKGSGKVFRFWVDK